MIRSFHRTACAALVVLELCTCPALADEAQEPHAPGPVQIGGEFDGYFQTLTMRYAALDVARGLTYLDLRSDLNDSASFLASFGLAPLGSPMPSSVFTGSPYVDRAYARLELPAPAPDRAAPAFLGAFGFFRPSEVLDEGTLVPAGREHLPWRRFAESGFGFVGTPPLTNGAFSPFPPTGHLPVHAGANVIVDLLDPDSAEDLVLGAAPGLGLSGTVGPVDLGVVGHLGVPGLEPGQVAPAPPALFPLPSPLYDGYALVRLGFHAGPIQAALYGRNDEYRPVFDFSRYNGHGFGATAALAAPAWKLELGMAEINRGRVAAGYYHEGSLTLEDRDLFGTGILAGVATKSGLGPAPNPSPLVTAPTTSQRFGQQILPLPYNWTSTGAYVRVPLDYQLPLLGYSPIPSLLLAFQASGPDFLQNSYGEGLSAIAELQPFPASPRFYLEYDQGKYSVSQNNNLFLAPPRAAAITQEQYLIGTTIKF